MRDCERLRGGGTMQLDEKNHQSNMQGFPRAKISASTAEGRTSRSADAARTRLEMSQMQRTREQKSFIALTQAYFQEYPESAGCVQHSTDSRNSASHSAYRNLRRPSSILEPRHPSLRVVKTKHNMILKVQKG